VRVATYNGGYAGMPNMDPQARVGFSAHGSFKRSDFAIAWWACAGYHVGRWCFDRFFDRSGVQWSPLTTSAAKAH
jgi:hypothetical protein